jgi:hypothetical protein
MRREHQWLPVKPRRRREEVAEEIDRVHVNDVGFSDVPQDAGCDRIPDRADEGYANDRKAITDFARGKAATVRRAENAVERHNLHVMAGRELSPRELLDIIFEAADPRTELPDDMGDGQPGQLGHDVPQGLGGIVVVRPESEQRNIRN